MKTKRKKAPLGRVMYTNDEVPGELVHDRSISMAYIESQPEHDGFTPYLVIDLSNPEAVVEAAIHAVNHAADNYKGPPDHDALVRAETLAILAALGMPAAATKGRKP